ncbi:FAD/NAD(P)-binding oxidoreductase family protein [Striga hermonthica]|uniref:FAD/NAD(P)-binding oxidoreductase family protein n=1 Tax=Striga hermonthica TaxID=68872 RepID=A0A9N7MZ98_STRHE|nr:FAD/NAD(P)-binding oxidoreductase family protein [Striga hermonthica]
MSQRRERCEDGKELLFDHGAPYFAVNASNLEVQSLVNDWESRGIVGEWKEKFGSFDFSSKNFVHFEEEGSDKRYVGVPGMNSICKALCHEPGIETKFGLGIGKLDWLDGDDSWSLTSLDGQNVGCFKGVVTSDKSTFSSRFRSVTGKPPPIALVLVFRSGHALLLRRFAIEDLVELQRA